MKKGLAIIFFVISVLSFAKDKKEPKLLGVNLEMKLSPMEEVKYYKSSKKEEIKVSYDRYSTPLSTGYYNNVEEHLFRRNFRFYTIYYA